MFIDCAISDDREDRIGEGQQHLVNEKVRKGSESKLSQLQEKGAKSYIPQAWW